jgi:tRNA modification GTPase
VTGRGAVELVARHFRPASGKAFGASPPGRITFGRFHASAEAEHGEELVVVARSDEDVEIHGHGGRAAVDAILSALQSDGCRLVDWRELLAAETADRIEAEAAIALAEARTIRTASILFDQQSGVLRRAVDRIISRIDAGEANAAAAALDELLRFAPLGRRLTEPFRVTLAGRPNVGKSSLLNALVGYARAIVFDQPGTTRDVVTAITAMDGWLVELADTAGRRESTDPLESAGIERAARRVSSDDLTLLVCDASAPWTTADKELLAAMPRALIVHNKCDLEMAGGDERPPGLSVSAATGYGLAELQTAIVAKLVPEAPQPGQPVAFTERQIEALAEALAALSRGDISCTRSALSGI